ncbi:MAG: alpha-amylase, partial [Candidatus Aenigmatarchaeota archaeon]
FEVMKYEHLEFKTPSEILREKRPVGVYDVPYLSSWADVHRDLSAWLENGMQNHAFKELKALEEKVKSQGNEVLDAWRKLQISDHFYFMCTKWFADGDVHKYFNPYENPYEAFINYMNVLTDLKHRLGASV